MNVERIINNIDKTITNYNEELNKFNYLDKIEIFIQELDNNFQDIDLNKYKIVLLELMNEEEINYYFNILNDLKSVYSYLDLELDLTKSLKKDLEDFKEIIKDLYNKEINNRNNIKELITKINRLKEYVINFDNFDISNFEDLYDLFDTFESEIDLKDELAVLVQGLKFTINKQKETEIISVDSIEDIADITDKNQEDILEELIKLEDDETKEFTEKFKEIKKVLDENKDSLNEFYLFNDGIRSYILNKDIENIRIMCDYNNLNFNKLLLLSIIIPSLVNLENMTEEIEGYTRTELIELMDEYLNDYHKALQSYKEKILELANEEVTKSSQESESKEEIEEIEEEKELEERANILENDEKTFLSNCYNFILFAKDINGKFYIDENLTLGDKKQIDSKRKGISKAIKFWATQIMHSGLAGSYIDKRSRDNKLYPGTDIEDEKAYEQREFKPRRFRCTNEAREAYMVIPTCQENMKKLANHFNNPNINPLSKIVMFIGVDFIPSKQEHEYRYLNKLVDDNPDYKRKILSLFNDPQTDINILVEIIEESTRYSLEHIHTKENLEPEKGKH